MIEVLFTNTTVMKSSQWVLYSYIMLHFHANDPGNLRSAFGVRHDQQMWEKGIEGSTSTVLNPFVFLLGSEVLRYSCSMNVVHVTSIMII